ncbi:hypothetical protein C1H46_001258 [Malus baccata]|uniref:Uncharacterized protein n=1 Tax=Malus baccata TaxID=106549 RepID=A0A540NQ57_MALBA|nr:hypothetical protein C1H46_001258 [Malus baccata]
MVSHHISETRPHGHHVRTPKMTERKYIVTQGGANTSSCCLGRHNIQIWSPKGGHPFDMKEKCSIEFNTWKMVPVDVKNLMVHQLSVVWDVDEIDEKQRKYVDELMKKKFWEWKFDVQRAVDHAQVDNAAVDAHADDTEED